MEKPLEKPWNATLDVIYHAAGTLAVAVFSAILTKAKRKTEK